MKSIDGGPSCRYIYCCVNYKKDAAAAAADDDDDDDDDDDEDDDDDASFVSDNAQMFPPGNEYFSTADLKAVVFKNKMPLVILKKKPKLSGGDSEFLKRGENSLFGSSNTSDSVADSPNGDGKRR
jgi:hypothetical protein